MNFSHLLATGAIALSSSVAYSQNAGSQAGQQNASVQVKAGKIIDSNRALGLPQGGEGIPTFNQDVERTLGDFRGAVQGSLFITPDGKAIKSESIVGGRSFTLGDATGTIGVGKLASPISGRAWGVNISIK